MTGIEFVFPILTLLGFYLFISNLYWFNGVVTDGVVWGIQINSAYRQKALRKKHTISAVVGLALFVITLTMTFKALLIILFDGGLFGKVFILACVIAVPVIFVLSIKKVNRLKDDKSYIGETNALVLEQLPIIQRVNEQMSEANSFIIAKDGIGLVDARNYCFAAEYFRDYRLGDLSTAREMALVGMYFAQKYKDEFTYEPTFKRTFIPGAAITSMSSEEVYVKSGNGTVKSKLESYVFYRKAPAANSMGQPISTTQQ